MIPGRLYPVRYPYPGYVILKAYPKRTDDAFDSLLFCNKMNRSHCQTYIDIISGEDLDPKLLPQLVTRINSTLFERIGGVLYYDVNPQTSGWLLFFNIDGRPKYCFTEEDKDLSEQVRHENNSIQTIILNTISVQFFE